MRVFRIIVSVLFLTSGIFGIINDIANSKFSFATVFALIICLIIAFLVWPKKKENENESKNEYNEYKNEVNDKKDTEHYVYHDIATKYPVKVTLTFPKDTEPKLLGVNLTSKFFPDDYTIFDLETTGLSYKNDKITEISALKIKDNEVVDKFQSLVNPEIVIPENITKLTGITTEMVESAPTISEILPYFLDFISGEVVMGHNLPFDIKFINKACLDNDIKMINNPFIDTLWISRDLLPKLDNHKLETIAKYFNITDHQDHRALSDCYLVLYVYQELKNIAKNNGDREFVELPEKVKPFLWINKAHVVKSNEDKMAYDVPKEYRSKVSEYIVKVNDILKKVSELVSSFTPLYFDKDKIVYTPFIIYSGPKYANFFEKIHPHTQVIEEVFTSKGNIKKHPFVINFEIKRDLKENKDFVSEATSLHGRIFLNKTLNISRMEINHTDNGTSHAITCELKDNKLIVSKVDYFDANGRRVPEYSIN